MRDSVLLVEDEEALRMTVGDRLRNEGYAVEYAVNALEAFEKSTLLPFDLIILDIMLPRGNGFDVLPRHRRGWAHHPDSHVDGPGPDGGQSQRTENRR